MTGVVAFIHTIFYQKGSYHFLDNLYSCAVFCASQVCALAQILRVKNLIFHTTLHSCAAFYTLYVYAPIQQLRINNIFPHYSFSRSSSAISLILRSLWFTPDFPTGGSRYVPSSLSGVSGYSNRSNAISFRFSGRLSKLHSV